MNKKSKLRASNKKTEKLKKAFTIADTDNLDDVKPRYTRDPIPDGRSRAIVTGMDTTRYDKDENFAINNSLNFEIFREDGCTIKKAQPLFYPGDMKVDFPYIESDRLSRLNLLIYDLCHHANQRLGSEGTVIIKTELIDGEVIQFIENFIPDVELDDLI